jgi:hypothetical protein
MADAHPSPRPAIAPCESVLRGLAASLLALQFGQAQAAEPGKPVCAVFGAGATAALHCGHVTNAGERFSTISWTDCADCAPRAASEQLFDDAAAGTSALAAARTATIHVSQVQDGQRVAGFAAWATATLTTPLPPAASLRPPDMAATHECSSDVDGDGAPDRARLAAGPLPSTHSLLLGLDEQVHLLFRGEFKGTPASGIMVACRPGSVALGLLGSEAFSLWSWTEGAFTYTDLWATPK